MRIRITKLIGVDRGFRLDKGLETDVDPILGTGSVVFRTIATKAMVIIRADEFEEIPGPLEAAL